MLIRNAKEQAAMKLLDIRPLLIVTAALAAVVGCERGPGKQSPTSLTGDASVAEPVTRLSLADQVRLEQVGEEWDAYGNFLPILRLTNHAQYDISCPSDSTASPVYMEQVRGSDSEGWRGQNLSWCGVGLGTQNLRTGQSATFTVLPPEGAQSWRIGIEIEHPEAHVIWTPPIAGNAEIVREPPSAVEVVETTVVRHPDRDFPYTFTLKNVSDGPLYYGGFKEPHVPPIYLNQEKRSEGWEDNGKANWCGTGFGFKALPPGGSISFSIPAQSLDSTWRIGIRLFKTARPASYDDAYSPV